MNCHEVQDRLAAYVDGEALADRAAIAAHLETCAPCRELAQAQGTARAVLKARGLQLAPVAPPGLRTRIAANLAGPPPRQWNRRPSGGPDGYRPSPPPRSSS